MITVLLQLLPFALLIAASLALLVVKRQDRGTWP